MNCSHLCSVSITPQNAFVFPKSHHSHMLKNPPSRVFCTHTSHCTGDGKKHTYCMSTQALSGHKSAGTRPVQAWCNIQGFIQSLHTVHQSEIYSGPSTKVRQVHHKICGWNRQIFRWRLQSVKCVWVFHRSCFQSMLLHPNRCHSRSYAQEWQVSRVKIINNFPFLIPLILITTIGCQILAKHDIAPPLPWQRTIQVSSLSL